MHTTIVRLTESAAVQHFDEDEVFTGNQDRFQYVTEVTDEYRCEEDIDAISSLFGDACSSGVDIVDGVEKYWILIDNGKLKDLFTRHWKEFSDELDRVRKFCIDDFITGRTGIECALYNISKAYDFDWLYILDENCDAHTIASWIRDVTAESPDKICKYYVEAVYDGAQ